MTAKAPTIMYLTSCRLKMDNISLKSGLIDPFRSKVKLDKFPSSSKDRCVALPLPKLDIEGPVHVLDILSVADHCEIAVFTFY